MAAKANKGIRHAQREEGDASKALLRLPPRVLFSLGSGTPEKALRSLVLLTPDREDRPTEEAERE